MSLKGFDIRILDGAGADDCHDYIIEPPLGEGHTYGTIGAAVQAITGRGVRREMNDHLKEITKTSINWDTNVLVIGDEDAVNVLLANGFTLSNVTSFDNSTVVIYSLIKR